MLKLTKTGIGLLTKQYRSVLRKCLFLNFRIFMIAILLNSTVSKFSFASYNWNGNILEITSLNSNYVGNGVEIYDASTGKQVVRLYDGGAAESGALELWSWDGNVQTWLASGFFKLNNSGRATGIDFAANVTAGTTDASHLTTTGAVNQLLNYYYTFRVDEMVEVIEFAKELRSNKKEMSSLDFMPIKSSSDLRINLIKAEDPLTFSAKTRDDSLVLMEVCHA